MAQNKKGGSGNRKQRREQERRPAKTGSSKPMWLRVAIVAVMLVMLLGFFILPLIR